MSDRRAVVRRHLCALAGARRGDLQSLARRSLHPQAVFDIACPVDRLAGVEAVTEGFYEPLRRALRHLHRRDEIFIGGRNRLPTGGQWIAAVTHYVGNFESPLFGIPPSGHVGFLRSGEFYRLENGLIVEAKIIIDLPDLARQAGRPVLPAVLGTQMLFPGPASHDGVLPRQRRDGASSLSLVETMLGELHAFDPQTFGSKGQPGPTGYWHEDMLWHGPGGIGTSYRWEGFIKDHREPFLRAFPDRKGGNHFCHIGDGSYAAVSGWPSMAMTHTGEYLGVPATGRRLTLRVMDFYRCAGGRIMENWVFLDLVDLFAQMDVDLIQRSKDYSDKPQTGQAFSRG